MAAGPKQLKKSETELPKHTQKFIHLEFLVKLSWGSRKRWKNKMMSTRFFSKNSTFLPANSNPNCPGIRSFTHSLDLTPTSCQSQFQNFPWGEPTKPYNSANERTSGKLGQENFIFLFFGFWITSSIPFQANLQNSFLLIRLVYCHFRSYLNFSISNKEKCQRPCNALTLSQIRTHVECVIRKIFSWLLVRLV